MKSSATRVSRRRPRARLVQRELGDGPVELPALRAPRRRRGEPDELDRRRRRGEHRGKRVAGATFRPTARCRRRRARPRRRAGRRRRRGARSRRPPPRARPRSRAICEAVEGPMTSSSPSPSARRSCTGAEARREGERRELRHGERRRVERRRGRGDELAREDPKARLGLARDRVELLAVASGRGRSGDDAGAVELGEHGRQRGRLAGVLGEPEEGDPPRAGLADRLREGRAPRRSRPGPAREGREGRGQSAGWRRSRSRAVRSWPGTKPLPIESRVGLGEPLGAERGGREGRGHAEEDDGPVVLRAQDARRLRARRRWPR